jgi:hypothetical protein
MTAIIGDDTRQDMELRFEQMIDGRGATARAPA